MFIPVADAVVAHRYRLVEEIGRGGMGSVWKAIDLQLDAPCALKFILDQQLKPTVVRRRFLHEARAAARLQSPHVVSVRSVGEWDEALYIAMELLSGETLAQRLRRTKALTPQQTLHVVRQVSSVLTRSHQAGIVHRDLKPENIWLWSGGELFVKVLDFGVAKQLRGGTPVTGTKSGVLVGTPYYMSPEQAAGDRQIDHTSDLWALAVIAIECLSGQRPFASPGLGQLLSNIINRRSRPLAQLYPGVTPALEAWWHRATAIEPRDRYGSADALTLNLAVALELERPPARLGASNRAQERSAARQSKSEEPATIDAKSGFDVWRSESPSSLSGAPVTADVASVRLMRFGSARAIKALAVVGALGVAGFIWQLGPKPIAPAEPDDPIAGVGASPPAEQPITIEPTRRVEPASSVQTVAASATLKPSAVPSARPLASVNAPSPASTQRAKPRPPPVVSQPEQPLDPRIGF